MTAQKENHSSCWPIRVTLQVLGGKWKPLILWSLREKTMRFSELAKSIEGITQKMLTQELRELEHHGIILRKVYAQVPPKVEYSLTDYGKTLLPSLVEMYSWGEKHKNRDMQRSSLVQQAI